MIYQLEHKTVLVTGANRGIGLAFVEALLARGVEKVIATTRDLANAEALSALSSKVEVRVLDITNPTSIAALVQTLPKLDFLINNAGIASASTFSAASAPDVAADEMRTNYLGTLAITHALLPLLQQSSAAAIMTISSIAGLANFPPLGPYSAAKAAVHFMTQGLRAELKAAGIAVVGVYPGPTDTRLAPGPQPKAQPLDVANASLDALEAGLEDVFPDAFSAHMSGVFQHNPKALEQQFSAMLG